MVTGGSLNLSRLPGDLNATFNNNFSQSGGTVSIKRANGVATVNFNRNFSHTGGDFYYRNASAIVSNTPITLTVTGSFWQTGGLYSMGNDASGTGINTLNLKSSSVNFGGTGVIGKTTTNNNYGIINFNRQGTTSFTRSGMAHSVQQVK
jgi:hypothetical protein